MSIIDCNVGSKSTKLGASYAGRMEDALGNSFCSEIINCFGSLIWHIKAHCQTGVADGGTVSTVPTYGINTVSQSGSSSIRPTWHEDVINGYATYRFDGSRYFNISTPGAGGNRTIFVVANVDAIGSDQSVVEQYTPGASPLGYNCHLFPSGALGMYHSDGAGGQALVVSGGSTTVAAGETQLWVFRSVADDDHEIRINGSIVASDNVNMPCASNSTVPGLIGAHNNGSSIVYKFGGDIPEMVVISTVLDDAEVAAIENCLIHKYGIVP